MSESKRMGYRKTAYAEHAYPNTSYRRHPEYAGARKNIPAYNNTSLAYNLESEALPSFSPDVVRRRANQERIERRNFILNGIRLMLIVGIIFSGCVLVTTTYASIAEQKVINSRLKDELASLQSENIALESDIADKVNLDYVEYEAVTRLGMSKPQSYQIKYVDVAEQSYTIQYDVPDTEGQETNFLTTLTDFLKRD